METHQLMEATKNLVQVKEGKLPIEATNYNTGRAKSALNDKMICDCTEDEVKAKLVLIYSMVGLRPQHYPVGQEKQDLHDYLRLKYSSKTLSELVLAFDLAISNELDLKLDDVKIYDQFTIAYLAQIMSAYKVWLVNQSKNVKMEQPTEVEPTEVIDTIDMIDNWRNDENLNMLLIPLFFYDFLVDTEMIKVDNEMKWEWFAKAKESIKAELLAAIPECKTTDALKEWKLFESCEIAKKWDDVLFGRIANRAKRLIVFEYLTKK